MGCGNCKDCDCNNLIKPDGLETFELKDLVGRVLKVESFTESGVTSITAVDVLTSDWFVLEVDE